MLILQNEKDQECERLSPYVDQMYKHGDELNKHQIKLYEFDQLFISEICQDEEAVIEQQDYSILSAKTEAIRP